LAGHDGYLALRYQTMKQVSVLEKLSGLMVYLLPAHKERLNYKAMYLRVKSGARLLDVGCGNGNKMQDLKELGWQVEGLDLDPEALADVVARGMVAHTGNLEEQCFPGQLFDAIVSSHVIEHVHESSQPAT